MNVNGSREDLFISIVYILSRSPQFVRNLATPLLLTTAVMLRDGEAKSHYISLAVALAAESYYSSLTVSKRTVEPGYSDHPSLFLTRHAPLTGNCLILQEARGETAVTPTHVSLFGRKAWAGVDLVSPTNAALGQVEHCPEEERLGSASETDCGCGKCCLSQ